MDAVVEGLVLRSGNRVRITAQLIGVTPERHLWAKTFDRDLGDVLALHSEVAQAIAREIKIAVTPEEQTRLATARTVNPEAYRLYLIGRFYWNKRTEEGFKIALDHFQRAIEIDPAYAPAYAGLADSYIMFGSYGIMPTKEVYPRARAAAQKALEIDESLAEAHASLANVSFRYYWDWPAAEKEYKRALELNPNYASAHQWYGQCLSGMGRYNEGIHWSRRAVELDPLSPVINRDLAGGFTRRGRTTVASPRRKARSDSSLNSLPATIRSGPAMKQKECPTKLLPRTRNPSHFLAQAQRN